MDDHLMPKLIADIPLHGGRAVILCNGPSLTQTPLHLLAGEQVWALNRAYLLLDRIDWQPSFYVVTDPLVLANSIEPLAACIRALPRTQFFFPQEEHSQFAAIDGDNVCWFPFSDSATSFADGHAHFGVVRSATVAVVAMQLAALLGFSKLILVGCDMNYDRTIAGAKSATGTFTYKSDGFADADHFHPDYLDPNVAWTVPQTESMFRDFERLGSQFARTGITVVNTTIGGRLDCYPRGDLRTTLVAL